MHGMSYSNMISTLQRQRGPANGEDLLVIEIEVGIILCLKSKLLWVNAYQSSRGCARIMQVMTRPGVAADWRHIVPSALLWAGPMTCQSGELLS